MEAMGDWGRMRFFCNFLKQNSYFNAIGSHFERVQSHLNKPDFYHINASRKKLNCLILHLLAI